MKCNYILFTTKGGVGKTFLGRHVLPIFSILKNQSSNVSVIEFENTNKLNGDKKSKIVSYTGIDMTDDADIIEEIAKLLFLQPTNTIIDIGGGRDAEEMMQHISNSSVVMQDFIPIFLCEPTEVAIQGAVKLFEKFETLEVDTTPLLVVNKLPIKEFKKNTEFTEDFLKKYLVAIDSSINKLLGNSSIVVSYIPKLEDGGLAFLESEKKYLVDTDAYEFYRDNKTYSTASNELATQLKNSFGASKEGILAFTSGQALIKDKMACADFLRGCEPFFNTLEKLEATDKC